jgi:hypothetical protein
MTHTFRAWLRYVVPFSVLAVIALAPIAYVGLGAGAPTDVLRARADVRLGWILVALGLALQLWLVAAVAPGVRSVETGAPLSQWRAFASGIAGLVRGVVPWATAIVAVLLGGVALVVPGLVLLVLVSLTGASEQLGRPLPAPIADSVAVARAHLPHIAVVVGAVVALDVAVALAAQLAFVPLVGKKVAVGKLAPIRTFVRISAAGVLVLAPLAATALAAAYSHAKRR